MNRIQILGILAMALPVLGEPAPPKNQGPVVTPFFMLCGALLKDAFDGPEIDTNLWSRPQWLVENHGKEIGAKIEDGHLVISGKSRPKGQSHQYAGILSKYFRETDVVLVADMQVRSSFENKGRVQHMIHLCSGDYPDFFTEIIFGKISAIEPPRWHAAYVAKIWDYSGFGDYLQPTAPAAGNEDLAWQTVVLTHDGVSSKTENFLIVDGRWTSIGPSHIVRFNHTHIELKVDVNVADTPIYMAVDNVRLYPNPANNPATIVLYTGVSGGKPKLPILNRKVQIFEKNSARLLGEALTDEGGEARMALRSDTLYPAAARIIVWDGENILVEAEIPRSGLNGLYPGDVWALDTRHAKK